MSHPDSERGDDAIPAAHATWRRHPGCDGTNTRVWLLRHAQVHEDWQGKAYGDVDVPLSALGLRRTEELARDFGAIEPGEIHSSPLSRALQLAERLSEVSGAPVRIADGLREIHRGSWQGLTVEELHTEHAEDVRAFYADPWTWRGHGGECDAMLAARAWPVLERALAQSPAEKILLTTHYNVIRVLVSGALGIEPARSFALRVDPGCGVLLVDRADGWHLHVANTPAPVTPPEIWT